LKRIREAMRIHLPQPGKESYVDGSAAGTRISRALDQEHKSVHPNLGGKRRTATLHVGNLQYNIPCQLPRLACQEGCCNMSIDCVLSTIHRPAGMQYGPRAAGLSSVIHGPLHEPDHGQRYYKQDNGPSYEQGRPWGLQIADADTYGRTSRPSALEPAAGVVS
jgi:hypothetical protein